MLAIIRIAFPFLDILLLLLFAIFFSLAANSQPKSIKSFHSAHPKGGTHHF